MKLPEINQAADEAVALLKALANATRLKLLCSMLDQERSVGQLADALGVRDTVVSQHLALLRRDGLVAFRRDGQTLWYRLDDPAARELIGTLYRIYCAPARPGEAHCGPARPGTGAAADPAR